MRSHAYHPPRFTPRELAISSLIVFPLPLALRELGQAFGWSHWIAVAAGIVCLFAGTALLWRMRLRRIRDIGQRLKRKAAERRDAASNT